MILNMYVTMNLWYSHAFFFNNIDDAWLDEIIQFFIRMKQIMNLIIQT